MVLGWRAVSYERGTPVAQFGTALGSGLVRLEETLSARIQLASAAQVLLNITRPHDDEKLIFGDVMRLSTTLCDGAHLIEGRGASHRKTVVGDPLRGDALSAHSSGVCRPGLHIT